MAQLTANRPVNALGGIAGNLVLPPVLAPIGPGLAAGVKIYSGAIAGLDVNGNMVDAGTAACVTVIGISRRLVDNSGASAQPPTSGLAGAISGEMLPGPYSVLNDGTILVTTPYGTDLFVVDDQTVSTSDASATGGVRLRAGYFVAFDAQSNPICMFGVAAPSARAFGIQFASVVAKARGVVTSLQAYTGTTTGLLTETANGAWAAQDGITNVVGDVVFIQEGTTNLVAPADAGPWVINSLGSAGTKWVLQRPDWYAHGSVIPVSYTVDVGGEGTLWAGSAWRSFAAPGLLVDTGTPLFFVGRSSRAVTLVTGFATVAGQTGIGIRSLTTSQINFIPTNFNGAATTVSYRPGVYASGGAATVAGNISTASVSITALVAAGTFNTNDIGTGLLEVINW